MINYQLVSTISDASVFPVVIKTFTNPPLPYICLRNYSQLRYCVSEIIYPPCNLKAPCFSLLNYQRLSTASSSISFQIIIIVFIDPLLSCNHLGYYSRLKAILFKIECFPCVLKAPYFTFPNYLFKTTASDITSFRIRIFKSTHPFLLFVYLAHHSGFKDSLFEPFYLPSDLRAPCFIFPNYPVTPNVSDTAAFVTVIHILTDPYPPFICLRYHFRLKDFLFKRECYP